MQKTKRFGAILLALILLTVLIPALPTAQAAKSGVWEYDAWDNEIVLTGYTGKGGHVTIPSKLDGKIVTGIGVGLFNENTKLTGVTIPDSVTSIGTEAFVFCTNLTDVTFPASVAHFSGNLFYGCTNLTGVTILNSNAYFDYSFSSADSSKLTIYGYAGSTAQAEAKRAGIPFKALSGYTVKFNKNGGSGSMASQSFPVDQSQKLPANSFTRKGYSFSGWNTKANGSGTQYTNKKSVKNLAAKNKSVTLYAQWKKVSAPTKAVTDLKLTSPAAKQLKVTYKAVSGADGYRIQYSTSKSFTKATTKTIHTTKLTYTLKNLTPQKLYYVRVTALNQDSAKNMLYSTKSVTKSLKAK